MGSLSQSAIRDSLIVVLFTLKRFCGAMVGDEEDGALLLLLLLLFSCRLLR
jgi:vacuolar-type H+-ATPase subunit I/STV1